jgi:hypothetical protein
MLFFKNQTAFTVGSYFFQVLKKADDACGFVNGVQHIV